MNEFTAEDMTVLLEAFAHLMDSDFATGFAEYLDLSDEYLSGLRVKVGDALMEKTLVSQIESVEQKLAGGDYTLCPSCRNAAITWEELAIFGKCATCGGYEYDIFSSDPWMIPAGDEQEEE